MPFTLLRLYQVVAHVSASATISNYISFVDVIHWYLSQGGAQLFPSSPVLLFFHYQAVVKVDCPDCRSGGITCWNRDRICVVIVSARLCYRAGLLLVLYSGWRPAGERLQKKKVVVLSGPIHKARRDLPQPAACRQCKSRSSSWCPSDWPLRHRLDELLRVPMLEP